MDIYQRDCKKEGMIFDDLKEGEVEILEVGSDEEIMEEEQQIEEDKIDIAALQMELECMKRRIQKLQLILKTQLDECPDDECVDYEVELTCSENKEICALQKGHHKLQCQIYELVKCCKFAKDQIKDLRVRICQKSREILELQKMVAMLNSWKMTLEHEFGVCIERFEYLKHVKAEWGDVERKFDEQKKCYSQLEANFAPKKCYVEDKKHFLNEMNNMKILFKELFDLQAERFFKLEQRINDNCLGNSK